MAYRDLESFVESLKREGELIEIKEEISPRFEASAILKKLGQAENPAVLFRNVAGYGMPVVGNLFGSRKRLAMALETSRKSLNEKYLKAKERPIPPVSVEKRLAKEFVIREGIDIPKLIPALTHHRKDKNPYFTQAIAFMKNYDTGKTTMGIHRMEVKGGNRLGIFLSGRTSSECLRVAEIRGEPLEVAVVLGVDPAILLASITWFPFGDKLALAGGLRGDPVEVIRAESVDLDVPANASIVLEGTVLPNVREEEGPFGESNGIYATFKNPVIAISTMALQEKPLYPAAVPCAVEDELQVSLAWGVETLKVLKSSYPSVRDLNLMCLSNAVISMDGKDKAQVREVLYLALISNQYMKKAIVVDEDIDIYNPREVEWSLATRFQPDRDLIVISGVHGLPIDPSVTHENITAKMGMDATRPLERIHSAEKIDIPEESVLKAEEILQRYQAAEILRMKLS